MTEPTDDVSPSFEAIVLSEEQAESARRTRQRTRSSHTATPQPHAFSWDDAVDVGDYDPYLFFVGSSDDEGSISVTVRVPAGVHQQMERMIQQRTIPVWTTKQDLIRDAIIHRMHFATHNYRTPAALARFLEAERTKARTSMARRLREVQTEAVDGVRDELAALKDARDADGLHRFLDDSWSAVGAFGEPYRTELRQVLEEYGPAPEWVQAGDWTPGDGHYLDALPKDF